MLQKHLVRLACIRHAASVHPEPGSNSPQKIFTLASVVYGCYWIDRVVASYHYSVVKVLGSKRAAFYTSRLGLSRNLQTKTPMSFDIGSSDCNPSSSSGLAHRLVSLTRDFSVFIDLSGGRDLVNVLANGYYMHLGYFVKGYQTINLRTHFFLMHPLTCSFAIRSFENGEIIPYDLLINHKSYLGKLLEYFSIHFTASPIPSSPLIA